MYLKHITINEDLKAWKDNILKMLHENGIKCPCGGSFNDWHSHDSDCIVINPKGKGCHLPKTRAPGKWGDEDNENTPW